ncbi:MAG: glycosyltransferase family 2 protein [Alphaproteobacteria bacterium]|nr:glycosyltransferase family 2 protein [Alphaproteobacteria bacterium]
MLALIPARNEGPRVADVVRRAAPHVRAVVVVVNGCTDDTEAQARAAGAHVLRSEPGYARALAVGYRRLRGEAVVQLDADGQHPPEAIPSLASALDGADIVIGSRFLAPGGYRVPPARRLGIAALSAWTTLLTGIRIRDVTSGFQALSPRAVAFFAEGFPEELADANVLVRAWRAGLKVTEVPVTMTERSGGRSMHAGVRAARHVGRVAAAAARERLR